MHAYKALFKTVTSVRSFGLSASNGTGARAPRLKYAGRNKIKHVSPSQKPSRETASYLLWYLRGWERALRGASSEGGSTGQRLGARRAAPSSPRQARARLSRPLGLAARRRGLRHGSAPAWGGSAGLWAPGVVRRGAGRGGGCRRHRDGPAAPPAPGPGRRKRPWAAARAVSGCCSGRGLAAGGSERQVTSVAPPHRGESGRGGVWGGGCGRCGFCSGFAAWLGRWGKGKGKCLQPASVPAQDCGGKEQFVSWSVLESFSLKNSSYLGSA